MCKFVKLFLFQVLDWLDSKNLRPFPNLYESLFCYAVQRRYPVLSCEDEYDILLDPYEVLWTRNSESLALPKIDSSKRFSSVDDLLNDFYRV